MFRLVVLHYWRVVFQCDTTLCVLVWFVFLQHSLLAEILSWKTTNPQRFRSLEGMVVFIDVS